MDPCLTRLLSLWQPRQGLLKYSGVKDRVNLNTYSILRTQDGHGAFVIQ